MPFQSRNQAKKCFALKARGQAGSWDCTEWADHTDFKNIPKRKEARPMSKIATIAQTAALQQADPLLKLAQAGVSPAEVQALASRAGVGPSQFATLMLLQPEKVAAWLEKAGGLPNLPGATQALAASYPKARVAAGGGAGASGISSRLKDIFGGALAGGTAGAAGTAMAMSGGKGGAPSPAAPSPSVSPGSGAGPAKPFPPGPLSGHVPNPATASKDSQAISDWLSGAGGAGGAGGGGAGGGAGAGALDWIKQNPGTAALMGLGGAGAGYGLYSMMRGKDKESNDRFGPWRPRNKAELVKRAADVYRHNAVIIFNRYLDKLAYEAEPQRVKQLRHVQARLIQGAHIKTAMAEAFPQAKSFPLAKAIRGLAKSAMAEFHKAAEMGMDDNGGEPGGPTSFTGKPAEGADWMRSNC